MKLGTKKKGEVVLLARCHVVLQSVATPRQNEAAGPRSRLVQMSLSLTKY